jgi:hypothetical protein
VFRCLDGLGGCRIGEVVKIGLDGDVFQIVLIMEEVRRVVMGGWERMLDRSGSAR